MTALTFPARPHPSPVSEADRAAILANPGFGKHYTDHMALATWTAAGGWHEDHLAAFGPLPMSPAAAVFHYAQEIFEGLKAYPHEDGSIWLFRPEANAERMQASSRRLALPELATEDFIASIRSLVTQDRGWVPPYGPAEMSLYLRPFMFASEPFLGVRPANEVTYCVIASPAAAYFSRGVKPVNLWISADYARAGAGGTGAAKCGGNYASSLAGQLEGIQHDCDQAVFLDSGTHSYIEELGGMNLFLLFKDGRLITPELNGSILPGVTRRSILEIAPELGLTPQERRIEIQEWKDGAASGELVEVFACGTAAVINPVGELRWDGGSCDHRPAGAGDDYGEVTHRLRTMLLDIQYGRTADTRGWLTRVV